MKRNLRQIASLSCFVILLLTANAGFGSHKPLVHHSAVSITAPADISVNTDPWTNVATNVTLGDPDVVADGSYTVSNNAPSSFPIGATIVTWTITATDGTTATANQQVTVRDAEKPQIFRLGEISVPNDPGKCGANVALFTPFAYDNSGQPVTITNDAPAFFTVGSFHITWTATDIYGNSDTSTQLVTVIDNEAPTIATVNISTPVPAGKSSVAVDLGTPVTSDNCDAVVSIVNDAPALFPIGTTAVHWTVTDKSGFTGRSTQLVTVTDNEKPVLVAPAPVSVRNDAGKCGAAVTLTAPAVSDNSASVTVTNDAPAFFPTGTTIVTWTATDNSGNTSQVTQSVTVKDMEAPVFVSLPATITVSCDQAAVHMPMVTDNCTAAPSVTLSETSNRGTVSSKSNYYNYTITRIWSAKDASGNTSTAKQVITVADRTAPLINVPAAIVVNNDRNSCGAVVRYQVTATDNCGSPVTLTYSKASGSSFSVGTTIVTVTAKDITGNTSSASFPVTVNDTQIPVIVAPAPASGKTAPGATTVTVNLGNPSTSDNCGIRSVTNNAPSSFKVGVTTVTWTVEDIHGNTATATQTVTVSSTDVKKRFEMEAAPSHVTAEAGDGTFQVSVAPNPSRGAFVLLLSGTGTSPVNLRVFDAMGRVVDAKSKLAVNSTVRIGDTYFPGIYYAELSQGATRKTVQLIRVR